MKNNSVKTLSNKYNKLDLSYNELSSKSTFLQKKIKRYYRNSFVLILPAILGSLFVGGATSQFINNLGGHANPFCIATCLSGVYVIRRSYKVKLLSIEQDYVEKCKQLFSKDISNLCNTLKQRSETLSITKE